MEIVIDYQAIISAAQNPITFIFWLFLNGGWIFLVAWVFYGIAIFWLEYRRGQYDSQRKFVVLAIDIPKNNEQSPKAVEQIFSHLSGAQSSPKREDKWIAGKMPESFSLEIISLGGYIQFLIQTPEDYRDLVEAAVYAQYPDAEIFEVEDYAQQYKGLKFPNENFNMWGAELVLANNQAYPLKSYMDFEHSLSQELKDPMGSLLEIFSKISPDEQIWLQYTITPADNNWKKQSDLLVKKLIGEQVKTKKSIWDYLIDSPITLLNFITGIFSTSVSEKSTDKKDVNRMQYLSPGQRATVEGVENKAGKNGFWVKVRLIYLARKEAYSPGKRVDAILGALKQFNDSNSLTAHKKKKTKVYGLFKEMRLNYIRTRLLRQYRLRARHYEPGYYGFVLSTEELASLYHFPVMTVKAPLVKKTESKKSEPPISLPIEHVAPAKPKTKDVSEIRSPDESQTEYETDDDYYKL